GDGPRDLLKVVDDGAPAPGASECQRDLVQGHGVDVQRFGGGATFRDGHGTLLMWFRRDATHHLRRRGKDRRQRTERRRPIEVLSRRSARTAPPASPARRGAALRWV